MAEPLIDRVLRDGRIIIADRSRRLRGMEAATAEDKLTLEWPLRALLSGGVE